MAFGILAFLGGLLVGLLFGGYLGWSWGDFWVNFISNAISGGIIGLLLYVAITRPDEQKARKRRLNQALSMLKTELEINQDRARFYAVWLEDRQASLDTLYPFRFTRGAWNALRESGFLPQLENARLVYMLLRINEVFVVANTSLMKIRNAWAEEDQDKMATFSRKAGRECAQILDLSSPLLEVLAAMNLPAVEMTVDRAIVDIGGDVDG